MTQSIEIFEQGLTKEDIPGVVNALVESVLEKGNPLEVAESIKVMEEIIEGVKKDKRYKSYSLDELAKYGKAGYTSPRGVKIEQFEAGTKYDYSQCGDEYLAELYDQQKSLEARVKEREAFLKTVTGSGLNILRGDELITVYPPSKTSTTTYKVTLSKK